MTTPGTFRRRAVRSVVASALAVAIAGIGGSAAAQSNAAASDTPASDTAACVPASDAVITAVLAADGSATFTVHNSEPLCEPVAIGVAAYTKDADGFVVPQSLVASATGTITSEATTLSVALPETGTEPTCFTQVDAFTGAPLSAITDTEQYGPRLLAYSWGTISACGEVLGESTTSTSTTGTTIGGNMSQPPAAVVEGESIVQAPPQTPVQTAPLARTGARVELTPLMSTAGWFLLIGGALLAAVNRRSATHQA